MIRFSLLCVLLSFWWSQNYTRELGVVTMFRNEGPYLKEWIEYHRMVGVEHFWLYNDNSTDNWEEVLKPYIQEGLVEVFHWPVSCRAAYVGTQCAAMQDAFRRALGNTKWVAAIDIDEFLVPLKDKTLTKCLHEHFANSEAIYVNWRMFGTSNVYVPPEKPFLFHLTRCSMKNHPRNCVGKSIVRPEYVCVDGIWYPHHFCLKPGAKYYNGDGNEMQFEGIYLKPDGEHHDKYIRINHYVFRDQGFYEKVRLARAKQGYGDGGLPLLLEQHDAFSLTGDQKIMNLIRKEYPEMYEKIWQKGS